MKNDKKGAKRGGDNPQLETIKMLPQKPDDILVSQLFHKVAALGRIHPAKTPVPSG